MLEVKQLSKKFKNHEVLDNISFTVQKGEIALFLGGSGVGKSTLLRVLNNLETIDSGSLLLHQQPLNLATVNQQHISGMVFQQFNLFENLTIERNITLALEKTMSLSAAQARTIALEMLTQYGLETKAQNYVHQLSGGQKQRVALVRALVLKPQIICLDEPTSALDPLLTAQVAHTINQLAQEKYIVLVASHDIHLLEKLDCTIYLMQQGKIVEQATSKKFAQTPEDFPAIARFVCGSYTE